MVNVPPSAFAAEHSPCCCATAAERQRLDQHPACVAASSKTAKCTMLLRWKTEDSQTDGQWTNTRPLHRPCSTYCASSAMMITFMMILTLTDNDRSNQWYTEEQPMDNGHYWVASNSDKIHISGSPFIDINIVMGWLDSRVVSMLDSGPEGPGSNRRRDAVG